VLLPLPDSPVDQIFSPCDSVVVSADDALPSAMGDLEIVEAEELGVLGAGSASVTAMLIASPLLERRLAGGVQRLLELEHGVMASAIRRGAKIVDEPVETPLHLAEAAPVCISPAKRHRAGEIERARDQRRIDYADHAEALVNHISRRLRAHECLVAP